jgi:hypothetical protein
VTPFLNPFTVCVAEIAWHALAEFVQSPCRPNQRLLTGTKLCSQVERMHACICDVNMTVPKPGTLRQQLVDHGTCRQQLVVNKKIVSGHLTPICISKIRCSARAIVREPEPDACTECLCCRCAHLLCYSMKIETLIMFDIWRRVHAYMKACTCTWM